MKTIDWLLEGDPAIRWQAIRDLTDAEPEVVAAERARVSGEGIGAKILACQGADGAWHRPNTPDWLTTLVSMQLLRLAAADPADPLVRSAIERLQAGFRWAEDLGGKPFSEGETEPCINGNALAASAYFGHPSEPLAGKLLREQLEDGGWNCEAPKSSRSSFHSTICVLEGLLEFEKATGNSPQISMARERGHQYLLKRSLFRRLSNGAIVDRAFLSFGVPPRYCYDVLRALDYFWMAGIRPQARVDQAIDVIESKRQADGRWLLDGTHNEALPFAFVEKVGEPSRWNTLRALRVLRWYNE